MDAFTQQNRLISLQALNALGEGGHIAAQGFIAQPQQAKLCLCAGVEAIGQRGAGGLQRVGQIEETGHRLAATQIAECLAVVNAGQQRRCAVTGGLHNGQVAGKVAQLAQQRRHILAAAVQLIKERQRVGGLPRENAAHQLHGLDTAGKTQHIQHGAAVQLTLRHTALVQQAQGIAQRAIGHTGQNLGAVGGQRDLLTLRHRHQLLLNVAGQNALESKALAAGENGGRHLVQLRGGQNEHQMLRRLLQSFQQSVERLRGQHMHLVDDIHAAAQHGGGVDSLFPQRTDVVNAVVGGGVHLCHVQQRTFIDTAAGAAAVAGRAVDGGFTVDGLGQNAGAGGLASAACAGEKIGVGGASVSNLPLKGVGNMGLTHDLAEGLGTPFAVQSLIHTDASFCNKLDRFHRIRRLRRKKLNLFFAATCAAQKILLALRVCEQSECAVSGRKGSLKTLFCVQIKNSPPYAATKPAPSRHMDNPS